MQAALPAKAGSKPHKIKHPLGSRVPLYIMLAPFMILFFLFTILPILTSLVLSFFNYDMVSDETSDTGLYTSSQRAGTGDKETGRT